MMVTAKLKLSFFKHSWVSICFRLKENWLL